MIESAHRLSRVVALLSMCLCVLAVSGCYTRLTTPKEARDWRVSYPELEANQPVTLGNARGDMGNTFIMTVEAYMDIVRKFRVFESGRSPSGNEPIQIRPGMKLDIKLPGHPTDSINNQLYVVRPEGTIDIGQLAEFPAAGKTIREFREDLSAALSKWLRPFPDDGGPVAVSVNLPVFSESLTANRAEFGIVNILDFSRAGSGGGSGGGQVSLRGDDTILSVMSSAQAYHQGLEWREIAVMRKVHTRNKSAETGLPIVYTIIVLVDLEKLVYEDPNLNMDVQPNDQLVLHPEKAPLIVEAVRTAQVITSIYGDFSGAESVLQDIFKRDF